MDNAMNLSQSRHLFPLSEVVRTRAAVMYVQMGGGREERVCENIRVKGPLSGLRKNRIRRRFRKP